VFKDWAGVSLDEFPHLNAWLDRLLARPGVEKGRHVPKRHTVLDMRGKSEEELDLEAEKTRAWIQESMKEEAKKWSSIFSCPKPTYTAAHRLRDQMFLTGPASGCCTYRTQFVSIPAIQFASDKSQTTLPIQANYCHTTIIWGPSLHLAKVGLPTCSSWQPASSNRYLGKNNLAKISWISITTLGHQGWIARR
jgi:hypothetical protein